MSARFPTLDQVRTLPAPGGESQVVPAKFIDENGHMNIGRYFEAGSRASWRRLQELGLDEVYLGERKLSFFTVEHRIAYLGELREGQRFSTHTGLAGRSGKALHAVSYVVDDEHDRLACAMEILYVHISFETRRATDVAPDLAASLDAEIASHPWVGDVATGLELRR